MRNRLLAILKVAGVLFGFGLNTSLSQEVKKAPVYRRHFVSTSMFVVADMLPNPASFFQVNYGSRITPVAIVTVEGTTCTCDAPPGIPYGPSHDSSAEKYPGSVMGWGIGSAYQRFLWKSTYAGLYATSLMQNYRDEKRATIQRDFNCSVRPCLATMCNCLKTVFSLNPLWPLFTHPVETNMPARKKKRKAGGRTTFYLRPVLILV